MADKGWPSVWTGNLCTMYLACTYWSPLTPVGETPPKANDNQPRPACDNTGQPSFIYYQSTT